MTNFRITFISNLLVQDFRTYESAADALQAPISDENSDGGCLERLCRRASRCCAIPSGTKMMCLAVGLLSEMVVVQAFEGRISISF